MTQRTRGIEMDYEEMADNILSNSRKEIKRILIAYIKRVEYLEGEEFYNSIKKDMIDTKDKR